jgi:antitoxin FitA
VSVDLSIKNVPDETAGRLKLRAKKHHRSLQGELLSIIEEAANTAPIKTVAELQRELRQVALSTPSEAADIIRADRDSR